MADVLNPDALHHELDRLEGWQGTTSGIGKTFTFADFNGSVKFVNRVARLADTLNHHPDVAISWNRVTLTLVTHSAGGVTQADIELARQLDPLAIDEPS
ncbi:MAG: 4a-hydroxytetrahydrobiopterin dehydratase [Nitriliruptorales bacterium]|nr:4a-hydroxytetrahydrobiopterin dehydratase [Nitriliruptorales bacterium]